MKSFQVAVVGLGAMGSAALYQLAKRGISAIGFDRYAPPHIRGSSHGESRIIRTAYYEDSSYVPLLKQAFDSWRRFEQDVGEQVLTMTGILHAGIPGSDCTARTLQSAIDHGLDYVELSPAAAMERFPAFKLPPRWDCLFEPNAGYLLPEKAIDLFLRSAEKLGAAMRVNCPVRRVEPVGDHVIVELDDGERIEAGKAIVAKGPWMNAMIPDLTLSRQPLAWFEPTKRAADMPLFFFQTPDDLFYGFPDFGGGVKGGSHLPQGRLQDPDAPRDELTANERAHLEDMVKLYLPAAGRMIRSSVCVYARTPDEHFVFGLHPDHPQMVVMSPCSGHGFKFASLFGEIAVDLALTGATDRPIGLFHPQRLMG